MSEIFNQLILEPCSENASGRTGECLPIRKCPEKFKLYRERNEYPQVCNGKAKTICCPEVSVRTTTVKPPARVSGESN